MAIAIFFPRVEFPTDTSHKSKRLLPEHVSLKRKTELISFERELSGMLRKKALSLNIYAQIQQ